MLRAEYYDGFANLNQPKYVETINGDVMPTITANKSHFSMNNPQMLSEVRGRNSFPYVHESRAAADEQAELQGKLR